MLDIRYRGIFKIIWRNYLTFVVIWIELRWGSILNLWFWDGYQRYWKIYRFNGLLSITFKNHQFSSDSIQFKHFYLIIFKNCKNAKNITIIKESKIWNFNILIFSKRIIKVTALHNFNFNSQKVIKTNPQSNSNLNFKKMRLIQHRSMPFQLQLFNIFSTLSKRFAWYWNFYRLK